jgi:hypothetical protein
VGLFTSIAPTQTKSAFSSGLSTSARAELRSLLDGRQLEAGPDAHGDQQPSSFANAMVMLPDRLELPPAPCTDDGASCVEPPTLLRLDAYGTSALFLDVLTNGLLANSSAASYASIAPLSVVANVSIPTHLAHGAQLACRSGAPSCELALLLPLLAEPVGHRSGAACVELVQVGGLVASVQVAYPAYLTTAPSGAAYATCKLPKLGTFMAVQYILADPVTVGMGASLAADASSVGQEPPATPAAAQPLSGGHIAAAVLGSVAGVLLLVGGLVAAARKGLLPVFRSAPAFSQASDGLASGEAAQGQPQGGQLEAGRSTAGSELALHGGLAASSSAAKAPERESHGTLRSSARLEEVSLDLK